MKGVKDRGDAELLRGADIYITRDELPELEEDQYLIIDLIGTEVYTNAGDFIGVLKEILQHGSADVYVVKKPNKSLMFPAIKDLILDIDLDKNKIIVDKKRFGEVAVYED